MQPDQSTNAPRIFTPDYYARMRALESASWWNAGMRDIAARLLADMALPPQGLMLDIGCGSGQTMTWFASLYPGWRTAGFDVAVESVTASRLLGTTPVCLGSALHVPVRTGTVDLAITLDVLQHLPLPDGDRNALDEIGRVLRPGGLLFVRTNAQSFPYTPEDRAFDFRKYTVPELRLRLEDRGFDVITISRLNALLGLAEIPRELEARNQRNSYHGILSHVRTEPRWSAALKRAWLRFEHRIVARGAPLPFGRTIVALCRTRA